MFQFTTYAEKKFLKLDISIQKILKKKLIAIRESGNFAQLTTLQNFEPATHRLRIGEYRLVLQHISANNFLVLDV